MRNAKDLIVQELRKDPELRLIHLNDAVGCLMTGEIGTGLLMIRNLVNATCGFVGLGKELDKDPKNLMRMLSSGGKPQADNLFKIINYLLIREGFHLEVKEADEKIVA